MLYREIQGRQCLTPLLKLNKTSAGNMLPTEGNSSSQVGKKNAIAAQFRINVQLENSDKEFNTCLANKTRSVSCWQNGT